MRFRPARLPIPDEHPCLERDGYGLSKYLMEEVTRYLARQHEDLDVIALRLAAICPDGKPWPLKQAGPLQEWGLAGMTAMCLSDAVRAFALAAEAAYNPGMRVMNAAGPRAWARDPVAEILRSWWGDSVDLSWFARPGHEWDSVFAVTGIQRELGFVAQRLPERDAVR